MRQYIDPEPAIWFGAYEPESEELEAISKEGYEITDEFCELAKRQICTLKEAEAIWRELIRCARNCHAQAVFGQFTIPLISALVLDTEGQMINDHKEPIPVYTSWYSPRDGQQMLYIGVMFL